MIVVNVFQPEAMLLLLIFMHLHPVYSEAETAPSIQYDNGLFLIYRIQLGQPATVKVAANLTRLLSYNNKVTFSRHFLLADVLIM